MSTETLRRLNSIDIPALAAARLAAVEAQNPPGTHHDTLLMQAMLQQNEELVRTAAPLLSQPARCGRCGQLPDDAHSR
jgi:hypothetical protein